MNKLLEAIPDELRARAQWVDWKNIKGKKIPINPKTLVRAKSDDPATWASFAEAAKSFLDNRKQLSGVGYVFSADDPYCGIDIDSCRSPATGEILPWAKEIIVSIGSYAEVSPSKTGVKIFCRAIKPANSRCAFPIEAAQTSKKKSRVEIYDRERYFCVTGEALPGFENVRNAQAELENLIARLMQSNKTATVSTNPNGEAKSRLLEVAERYTNRVPPVVDGERNDAAFRLAGHLAAMDCAGEQLSNTEILSCVARWNCGNNPPLPDDELASAVHSGLTNGTPRARKVIKLRNRSQKRPDSAWRPQIEITRDEGAVADQVIGALGQLGTKPSENEPHTMYQRGGVLVQIVHIDKLKIVADVNLPQGSYLMRPTPVPIIRERISQACELVVIRKKKPVSVEPPRWLVEAVAARAAYDGKIKPINGVVTSATIRPDGSILKQRGYDPQTGLVLVGDDDWSSIPSAPTRNEAMASVEKILNVVSDFPFVSTADKSAWLALLLTLVARPAIDGCCPLFAFTANCPGTGKGLLCDVAHAIALNGPSAKRPFTYKDEELRKSITAIALEGLPSVVFDNVEYQLSGASLDAALTAQVWSDRILGKSCTTGDITLRTVWSATGNNLIFGGDIARRVLLIRLETELESPELRDDLQHPNLMKYVVENRAELTAAALMIIAGYFAAGRPNQGLKPWGSFESWSDIIRSAIVWTGWPDPCETRKDIEGQDETRELLRLLIAGLIEADPDGAGLTSKQIEKITSERPEQCPSLVEAAAEICGGKFDGRRFGKRIGKSLKRKIAGRQIIAESGGGGVNRYRVVLADNAKGGFRGFSGFQAASPTRENFLDSASNLDSGIEAVFGNQPNQPNQPTPPLQPPDVPARSCAKCGSLLACVVDDDPSFLDWTCPNCGEVSISLNKSPSQS